MVVRMGGTAADAGQAFRSMGGSLDFLWQKGGRVKKRLEALTRIPKTPDGQERHDELVAKLKVTMNNGKVAFHVDTMEDTPRFKQPAKPGTVHREPHFSKIRVIYSPNSEVLAAATRKLAGQPGCGDCVQSGRITVNQHRTICTTAQAQ